MISQQKLNDIESLEITGYFKKIQFYFQGHHFNKSYVSNSYNKCFRLGLLAGKQLLFQKHFSVTVECLQEDTQIPITQ